MKICIFGAASDNIDRSYIEAVEQLSSLLAQSGHSLVYGAGAHGLMGASARGFKSQGAYVHGVVPEFFREHEVEALFLDCDQLTYTPTMADRKSLMEEEADAFIIVPGGIGTFEEALEVLTLKQLDRHKKPIVFFNVNDYYGELFHFLQTGISQGFMNPSVQELYATFDDAFAVVDYLDSYQQPDKSWFEYKVSYKA